MKAKKVLAMLMASAMIMGTSVTAFAAGTTPNASDSTLVSVSNVETGATVTAYQIVDALYNENGFVKYVSVMDDNESALVQNALKPTSAEAGAIAKRINNDELDSLETVVMTESNGTYSAQLEAGYWLVLVRTNGETSTNIYNPMLVSSYYSVSGSGSENTLTAGSVDADDEWNLVGDNAWAKSSEIPFEKTTETETADIGDEVKYKITTVVPEYGPEYTTVTFNIKDSFTGLTLNPESLKVKVGDQEIKPGQDTYQVTGNTSESTTFTVSFASTYILENGGKNVEITYSAIMTGDAVNEDAHTNDAELTYTNNPGNSTMGKKDEQKVYTFDIDGDVTGNILKKVQQGTTEDQKVALKDAEFTLYTDPTCTTQYVNTTHIKGKATAKSSEDGKLYITGLAAGTYYLKETKAPQGFSINDTVYKIEIEASIVEEELKSWSIKVTDTVTGTDVTNNFVVSNGEAQTSGGGVTEIMNTKLSSLPSTGGIGTTIFTIGGCAIMVTAAGLYFATRKKTEK